MIEILSNSESYAEVEIKINDYFEAGVQLVWYINPQSQKIYVYTSPTTVQILTNKESIIANPVLPDFQFVIDKMFSIE